MKNYKKKGDFRHKKNNENVMELVVFSKNKAKSEIQKKMSSWVKDTQIRKTTDKFKNMMLHFVCQDNKYFKENPQTVYLTETGVGYKDSLIRKFHLQQFKKQANLFVRRLATRHCFDGIFSEKDKAIALKTGHLPKNYMVDFRIPLELGGTMDSSNMYVVSSDVAEIMDETYWSVIKNCKDKFLQEKDFTHKLGFYMPSLPCVFTNEAFLDFVPATDRAAYEKVFQNKANWRSKLGNKVISQQFKKGILLSLQKKPVVPTNMSMKIVKADFVSGAEKKIRRYDFNQNRSQFLQACGLRGDFNLFLHSDTTDTQQDLTAHHVIPLACGGNNDINNIVFLPYKQHTALHEEYLDPIQEKFNLLSCTGKNIFIEIPVPDCCRLPTYHVTKDNKIVVLDNKIKSKGRSV